MNFVGIEKLSLVDFDEKVSCTLFTAGCNFACPFCHNGPLVVDVKNQPELPFEDILDYLKKRKGIIDAVCITGGEPTCLPNLKDYIKQIKELGFMVKLDTNGTHPDKLKELIEEKLIDYIAMDIKNSPLQYAKTVGLKNPPIAKIKESVDFLINGSLDYEFRTTLVDELHKEEDMPELGQFIKGAKKLYLQHFVDREGCIEHNLHEVSKEKALRFKELLSMYVDKCELRNY